MKDEGITLTFPDGTPLGKVTNFQASASVTGDVTPSKMTIGVKNFAYYDPFEKLKPRVVGKLNRKQRRKKK